MLLALTLLACPKPPAVTAAPVAANAPLPITTSLFVPPARGYRWTEVTTGGDGVGGTRREIEQRWSGPNHTAQGTFWTIAEGDAGGGPARETMLAAWTPRGFEVHGTTIGQRPFARFDPPYLVLPATPAAGDAWTGTHRVADGTVVRSCTLAPGSTCDGGLDAVCVTNRDDRSITLTTRYCPGVGFVGWESRVETAPGVGFSARADDVRAL
jgi:hypothetical protein